MPLFLVSSSLLGISSSFTLLRNLFCIFSSSFIVFHCSFTLRGIVPFFFIRFSCFLIVSRRVSYFFLLSYGSSVAPSATTAAVTKARRVLNLYVSRKNFTFSKSFKKSRFLNGSCVTFNESDFKHSLIPHDVPGDWFKGPF